MMKIDFSPLPVPATPTLQATAFKRYDLSMPLPSKPWWEWTLFIFAVLGAVKSFLWDWLIVPLRKRPKLVGEVKDVRLVSAGLTCSTDDSTTQQNVSDSEIRFDSEIRLLVSVHNKRDQPTHLREWALEVCSKGISKVVLRSFTPEQDRRWKIHGPLMREQIHFCWREPHEGWLYFRYPNRRPQRLESSRYSLFVIDIDNRKYRLHSGLIPRSGAGVSGRNALE